MDQNHELQQTVAGESAPAILAALRQIERPKRIGGGMSTMTLALPEEEMAPVLRAAMRIEAELLLEDANALVLPTNEDRTTTQRQYDAFELLLYRALAAVEQPPQA